MPLAASDRGRLRRATKKPTGTRGRRSRPAPYVPRLETLEDRWVPANLLVVNNGDQGPGSLRDALALAASGDSIRFDPSLNNQSINLASQLAVTDNVDIDGPGVNLLTNSGQVGSRVFMIAGG